MSITGICSSVDWLAILMMNGEQLCSSSSSSSGFCGVLRVSSSHDRYTLDSARTFLTVSVCRSISYMFLVFTARCCACAVLAMGLCLCLPVCVCVCLSQVGVLLKRINVGSYKNTIGLPRDCSFLKPKISAKFDRGKPLRGAKCRWGWLKSATFEK